MPSLPPSLNTRDAVTASVRVLLVLMGFGVLTYGPFVVYANLNPGWQQPPWILAAALALSNAAGFAFVLREKLAREGARWRDLGEWTLGAWPLVGAFLLATLGNVLVSSEVDNLFNEIWPAPVDFGSMTTLLRGDSRIAFVLIVIIAPLTEELFFRGWMLPRLARSRPAGQALLLTSLLFGAIHLNPWQMLHAFSAGVLLGWVMLCSGSVGLCVLGHAINNGIAFAGAYAPVIIRGFNSPREHGVEHQPWWLTVGGLLLLVAGIIGVHQATVRRRTTPLATLAPQPVVSRPELDD